MSKNWRPVLALLVTVGCVWGRPKDAENQTAQFSLANGGAAATTTEEPSLLLSTTIQNEEKLFQKKGIEELATVSRASSNDPSLSPSMQKVADQLIDTVSQLVDTRTPPVLQEKLIKEKTDVKNGTASSQQDVKAEPIVDKVEANGRFELKDASVGKAASSKKDEAVKGVAVPVIMDDESEAPQKKLQKIPNVAKPPKEDKKKLPSTTKPQRETPTTTPSSGLSTWILLSDNKDGTTPSTPKNKKNVTPATKKPAKIQTTTVRVVSSKPAKKSTPKPADVKKTDTTSVLEGMVKNQKKAATGRPILKNKNDAEKKDDDSKKVVTIPPAILVETTQVGSIDDGATDSTVETTTKKKKTGSKKRKKNKNRKKKPSEKTGGEQEIKDLVKQPKQPVGAQFYNFLSREIMPTVGLGLVGVLVTAGLAGLLGYNPFNSNLPVRRTYESQHGYSPNNPNYYTYNSEYGDTDGGQNEEVLFREVLSGMPDDNRYTAPAHPDASYPETQLYNSQEQAYSANNAGNKPASTPGTSAQNSEKKVSNPKTPQGSYPSAVYGTPYHQYSDKDMYGSYSGNSDSSSFVYPEQSSTTEKFKASAKYTEEATFEKQPEALYRVSSDYSAEDGASPSATVPDAESSWHRIGSPSMDYSQYSSVEPGPRRLNIDKMTEALTGASSLKHKRSKRSPEGFIARLVRRSKEVAELQNDHDNEIDSDYENKRDSTTEANTGELTTLEPTIEVSYTEDNQSSEAHPENNKEPNLIDSFPTEVSSSTAAPSSGETPPTFMDVIRRLAQFKLRLGINFLKTTADAFSKYLEGVQRKVEDTMVNDTSFPSMRNVFLGRDSNNNIREPIRVREKRFQRNAFWGSDEEDLDNVE